MMTLDEAKQLAKEVLGNTTRSHVQAAKTLAEFVLYFIPLEAVIDRCIRTNSSQTELANHTGDLSCNVCFPNNKCTCYDDPGHPVSTGIICPIHNH